LHFFALYQQKQRGQEATVDFFNEIKDLNAELKADFHEKSIKMKDLDRKVHVSLEGSGRPQKETRASQGRPCGSFRPMPLGLEPRQAPQRM
jgi:hypothetical protein